MLTASWDLFAPENVADPYPLYARLRETSPVHQVPVAPAWVESVVVRRHARLGLTYS